MRNTVLTQSSTIRGFGGIPLNSLPYSPPLIVDVVSFFLIRGIKRTLYTPKDTVQYAMQQHEHGGAARLRDLYSNKGAYRFPPFSS